MAIKGVVVRITPRPACAVVLGHTHSIATFKAACLFLSTVEVLTWICTQRKKKPFNNRLQMLCNLLHYSCFLYILTWVKAAPHSRSKETLCAVRTVCSFTCKSFHWITLTLLLTLVQVNHLPSLKTQTRSQTGQKKKEC